MTQRRGGRPRGPERVPFTTTLQPAARDELARRAAEAFGTPRAANRVIEEAMGFAAVQWSETEDVDMTIERDDWTAEAVVTVRLYSSGSAFVETVVWPEGVYMGDLSGDEQERAIEAARRKAEES